MFHVIITFISVSAGKEVFYLFFSVTGNFAVFYLLCRLIYRKKRRLAAVNHLLCSELKKTNDTFDLLFDNVNVNLEKLNYKNV